MPIRMTGINSGLDTDSIVQALVSSYSYKKDKYKKQQTKLQWTQDAWKSLNTKVYSLYTNISNLRFSSAYTTKKTTTSDTTKATVKAGNDAPTGSQKLNILQVAQSGYLTGGKISSSATTSTTLAELGYTGGDASISIDRGDGTSSTITLKGTSTIGDIIDQMKKEGLNASLDTTNHRLFISAKDTGKEADFNIIGADSNGINALAKLGLSTSIVSSDKDGNPVYTEAGKTYQKYAAFATDASGKLITDDSVIKQNISNAINAYNTASSKLEDQNRQISNLTSAFGYASAYADVQDSYAGWSISASEENRFNNVMLNYSESSTALVDTSGNIYNATTREDDKKNPVYSYVDKDGNNHYVSKETIYKDENQKEYRKTASGEYVSVNDASKKYDGDTSKLTESSTNYYNLKEKVTIEATDKDGNTTSYQQSDLKSEDIKVQNDNGTETTKKQYSITINGDKYVSDSEEGTFTCKVDGGEDKTITIGKKYSYEQDNTQASPNLKNVTDAYNDYKTSKNFTDEEATTFKQNLSKVQAFENEADKEEDKVAANSKTKIMETVHGTASADMDALVNAYAQTVSDLSKDAEQSQKEIEENSAVKNIAGLKDQALDDALNKMVETAKLAVEQLANAGSTTGVATKVDGQNSIIKLNGVEYENSTNSILVNGLTINAQAATGDGDENAITITTATDTQGVYDKIKDFLSEYNSIINEMCKLYNAASSKGYEPLTDDEKSEMSDKEVEKWEEKIKDSLLRRDQTLNGIMTGMHNAMMKSVSINGKNYSLSSFGIKTMGYLNAAQNENYAFHIDGDEDDANSKDNADKLMKMISSDPETVTSFFQQLATNLYTELGNKMRSTSLSSSYTIYNDKQMTKQYSEYTTLIKKWEQMVTDKEDYYYKKFTAMETAMAKLNSTQSSLSGYFS